ncbi:MAG: major capsid protein [Candidatus Competibacteraceae bacterium]|nr:major capsid protein [Candidatus Competibacteraceae bacterium]
MSGFDIINSDMFSLTSLTAAINEQGYQPSRIAELGLFEEQGISTTTALIEKKGMTLSLVPNTPRGGNAQSVGADKRTGFPVAAAHLPESATIMADEVTNVRMFGSENAAQAVEQVRDERLAKMRQNIEVTHEWHRIGAIKGQVLDADASTVIYDLFTLFNLSQQSLGMALTTTTTKVRLKCNQILKKIEDALGGTPFTMPYAFCGDTFWETLITHDNVEKFYINSASNAALRGDPRETFSFGGIMWERYRGNIGSQAFIADDDAYVVPRGVNGLFITRFAPADYVETVNTMGLPIYSKSAPMKMDKGVELEAQSNPIHLCTRPNAVIKLTKV